MKKRETSGTRFEIHGVTDVERWAYEHDFEIFTAPCAGCGAPLRTTIPFGYRTHDGRIGYGLTAPNCACGEHDAPNAKGRISRPPYCIHLEDMPGATRRDR